MLEIFQYDFMVRAFIAGIAIALIAPVIGSYLVVRRYSLIADTLAHVSLTGVAVGFLTGINPLITAIAASVISSALIEKLRSEKRIQGETLLALFLSGSLALATVLISFGPGLNASLFSYLFGSIATVTVNDIWLIVGLAIVVGLVVTAFYKELFSVSLDEELAAASGLPVKALNLMLLVLTGITVSLSMRIVGILLIGALMVIPVITAMQYKRGFATTMGLSVLFSVASVMSGLFLSYYFGLASGGVIVLIALAFFFASLFINEE
ncbi:MAG: hypothetical protein K0S20_13 [Patescibacteria group bacterium]|nr:hypothetical protein [Patescibacteria group bacterium]